MPDILIKCDSVDIIKGFSAIEKVDGFIYAPKDYTDFDGIEKVFSSAEKPIFLHTPLIARNKDLTVLERLSKLPCIKSIVAENLYAVGLFEDKNILCGYGMNLINSVVDLPKIAQLESDGFKESDCVTAYCTPTLMTFAHCPYKNLRGSCQPNCRGFEGTLTDERGNTFGLSHYKLGYCYAQLRNGYPLYLADELKAVGHKRYMYDFCGLSFAKAQSIFSGDIPVKHTHFNYNKKLK